MHGINRETINKRSIRQSWDASRNMGPVRRSDAPTRPPGAAFLQSLPTSCGSSPLTGTVPRALRDTFSDLDGTLRAGALIGGAMQSLSRESIELAGRAIQKHIDASLNVMNSRTPEEFLIAQHDLVRTTVAEFTSSVRRITTAISQIIE